MDMSSVKTNVKRFFSNPNTLTFILVIVLIVVVYLVYNAMVNKAISPVTLPYATELLREKTQITNDKLGTIEISGSFITGSGEGLIQSKGQLLDSYIAEGYQVPAGSFFYNETLMDEKTAGKNKFDGMPDNYSVFQLEVDFHTTYGCSIMPGNYIDLYLKAYTDQTADGVERVIFDKFIESIQVYDVVDEDGNNVFTYTEDGDEPEPKWLYFAVPIEYYELLQAAVLTEKMELIPVPRNAGYSENPKETSIANPNIENFIHNHAIIYRSTNTTN